MHALHLADVSIHGVTWRLPDAITFDLAVVPFTPDLIPGVRRFTLTLHNLRAVCVAHDPTSIEVRPSEMPTPPDRPVDRWPWDENATASLTINHAPAREDLTHAALVRWTLGDLAALDANPLHFEASAWGQSGPTRATLHLAADALTLRDRDGVDITDRAIASMPSEDDASEAPAFANFPLPAWSDTLLEGAPMELLHPLRERLSAPRLDDGASREARRVDDWWVEGDRACLTVVGTTAFEAIDEDPAEARATRWFFLLYRRRAQWSLRDVSETFDD